MSARDMPPSVSRPPRSWERAIPEADRLILDSVFDSGPRALGTRPALLVIDVTYAFTGTRPLPLPEAINEYPTSCGTRAWEALPRIRALLDAFRKCALPVVWTTGQQDSPGALGAATTRPRVMDHSDRERRRYEIHEQVAPHGFGTTIAKARASAFFGTPLGSLLNIVRADSVVLAGGTTSGCVRASAVDAFSLGYPTFVAADCCFDRSSISHDVSLFDLSHKYATVLDSDELAAQLPAARTAGSPDEGAL